MYLGDHSKIGINFFIFGIFLILFACNALSYNTISSCRVVRGGIFSEQEVEWRQIGSDDIPDYMLLVDSSKDEEYYVLRFKGSDFAYAKINESKGILQIELNVPDVINTEFSPTSGQTTLEAKEKFLLSTLKFVYDQTVAKSRGLDLISSDMNFIRMALSITPTSTGADKTTAFKVLTKTVKKETIAAYGMTVTKFWYGQDGFFQMEFVPTTDDPVAKKGLLTFKPSRLEASLGWSAIVQSKTRVLVDGYGTVGSKVADAFRRANFDVSVAKRSDDPIGRARDAYLKGYDVYIAGDDEDFQARKGEFEEVGVEVKGSVESLLASGGVDFVVNAAPNSYGYKNAERFYKRYGVRYILQGGEKDDVVDLSFSSSVTPWESLQDVESVRVVSCNTTAMARVFGAILKNFDGVIIDDTLIRRGPDPWQSASKGPVDSLILKPASHHAPDFKTVLPVELLERMTAINTDAAKASMTHFHVHQGTVRLENGDPNFTVEKVREILEAEDRVALVNFPKGELNTALLFEVIDKQIKEPDAYVAFVQVMPSGIPENIKITIAVPQENIVVPENVNALQAMSGLFGKEPGRRIVDESLGIDRIIFGIEYRLNRP